MEEIVKVNWEGQEAEIVIGQISWGDEKKAKRKSVVIQEYKGEPMQFRDQDKYEEYLLIAAIKKCPFDKTIENLYKLSREDGNKLTDMFKRLNEVSDKNAFLNQGLGEKQQDN